MKNNNQSFSIHSFYCLNCGNRGLELPRRDSKKHGKGHYKSLYCPHCRKECNHLECLDDEDVYNFKLDFEEGKYKEEAEESLKYIEENYDGINSFYYNNIILNKSTKVN